MDPQEFAEQIVSQTQLGEADRYILSLLNEVATPYIGTSRYFKNTKLGPKIYHRATGNYVLPVGAKGFTVVGGLALALLREDKKRMNEATAIIPREPLKESHPRTENDEIAEILAKEAEENGGWVILT